MKENYKLKVKCASVVFSAQCTLKCSYCFINECKNHNAYNKKLMKQLADGSLANNIIKNFPEDIEVIDFWGAEPTINAQLLDSFLEPLTNHFKDLKEFMFSTNGTSSISKTDVMIDALIKHGKKYNHPVNICVQLSVDGPEAMTDFNRGKGVTKGVFKYYYHLLERLNKIDLDNVNIDIVFKPTLSPDNMIEQVIYPEKMYEWFLFFNEKISKGMKSITNVSVQTYAPTPTVVVPGEHSKEDGIYFAKWLRALRLLNIDELELYKNKQLYSVGQNYMMRIHNMDYLLSQPWSLNCGGGFGSMSVSLDNEVHVCHRNFTNSIMTFEGKNTVDDDRVLKNTSRKDINNDYEKIKLDYMAKGYHSSMSLRFSSIQSVAQEAAWAGEIDEIFKDCDPSYYAILMLALSGPLCHLGNFDVTGDSSIQTMSQLRFWGNGAWKEMLLMSDDLLNTHFF